jgi:hypothetical protein
MEVLKMIRQFFLIPLRPPLATEADEDMQKAREWFYAYSPDDGRDYSLALTYAQQRYEEAKGIYATLDKKAEWLFGIGLLSISAAFVFAKEKPINAWLGLIALVFLAWGMLGALRARIPGTRTMPMSIRDVIQRVEDTTDATPWICASLQYAFTGTAKAIEWKAIQLKNSCVSIFIAIVILGLIVIFYSGSPNDPAPQKAERPDRQLVAPVSGVAAEGVSAEGQVLLKFGKAR